MSVPVASSSEKKKKKPQQKKKPFCSLKSKFAKSK